ncbi:MAG: FAD-binding protein, partial [Candidatus Electryoneaceae bacterium]|nr:FAD-binding protein [Candidatus Electryoneaceae bacterium]
GMTIDGDVLTVGSAVCLDDAVKYTAENGLGGWSKLAGIPGSVGGGLRMNAGAFRSFISDYVLDIDLMDWEGTARTIAKDEIGFVYRNAPGLEDTIILSAKFQLPFIGRDKAVETVESTIAERYRRNVMTIPSAGSVFKNPPGESAAQLIESVGGKGMKICGSDDTVRVEISPHHSNFIVNKNGGNASDIYNLIDRIREMVYDRYGIRLELEIHTLGFSE